MTNAGGGGKEVAIPGDWNIVCDVCDFKWKASLTLRRWDGLRVCPYDWEPRHPHDFLRTKEDDQSVPFTRSAPADADLPFITASAEPDRDFGCPTVTPPSNSLCYQEGEPGNGWVADDYFECQDPIGLSPGDPRLPQCV